MNNRKSILLTGSTGFLGGELLKRIVTLDCDIKILVRRLDGIGTVGRIRDVFAGYGADAVTANLFIGKIEAFEGDVTDSNLGLDNAVLHRLRDSVDEVFHCAAATKFSGLSRDALLKVNHEGARNLLDFCCSGKKKHFHYISTAYVAGKKRGIVYEGELDDNRGFHNDYEESKYLAEKAVHEYAANCNLPYTIYRPTIIVGDSRTQRTTNFDGIYTFARMLYLLKRRAVAAVADVGGLQSNDSAKRICVAEPNVNVHVPLRLPVNPDATINLVPVDFVADAIAAIFRDAKRANRTFHIVNPYPPDLAFLLKSISAAVGVTGADAVGADGFSECAMTQLERRIWDKIRVYGGYMFDEPYFHSVNTLNILDDFCIQCPKMTWDVIASLIDYAVVNNWGSGGTGKMDTAAGRRRHEACG